MKSQQSRLPTTLLVLGLLSCGLGGCSSSSGGGSSTSSTTSSGGATTSSGGGGSSSVATTTVASSSSAGSSASGGSVGGTKGSAGAQETGGSVATGGSDSGGSKATTETSSGGSATGGSSSVSTSGSSRGGSATGGSGRGGSSSSTATVTGGTAAGGAGGMATTGSGSGGRGGSGGSGGTATGGTSVTSSGGCQKGLVKAKEVLFMGESFYAIAPQYIQKRIEENAKKAGAIGANDSYRNVAISGQPMSVVVGEFDTGLQGGAVKFVIMDGGGIDCMSNSCDSCPGAFKTLLTKMASNGVQDVIYTRYPEPGNPPGSNATLKKNLDILMPKMEPVCAAATGLRCHWVDLRPVWVNGDTTDGLHPTQSGGNHVGDLIWSEMVKDCIAQ
jgi:hypothetical protein